VSKPSPPWNRSASTTSVDPAENPSLRASLPPPPRSSSVPSSPTRSSPTSPPMMTSFPGPPRMPVLSVARRVPFRARSSPSASVSRSLATRAHHPAVAVLGAAVPGGHLVAAISQDDRRAVRRHHDVVGLARGGGEQQRPVRDRGAARGERAAGGTEASGEGQRDDRGQVEPSGSHGPDPPASGTATGRYGCTAVHRVRWPTWR
jgi:hypothetical protein